MAYVKTTWEDGDTITAQGLNNIENGIETLDQNTIDDLCDFVIQANEGSDTGFTATKGTFDSIYTMLQNRPVFGIFKNLYSSGSSIYSYYIPITYVFYNSSSGFLYLRGTYDTGSGHNRINLQWSESELITQISS